MLSTTTALLQISDTIYQATDENKITEVMTVDQSSAFDCVEHDILVEKLKMYSLGENVLTWIKSFLEYRTQYVAIGNARSNMVPMYSGVPQGSVLGPLLYIVYTNELPEVTRDENCQNIEHRDNSKLFGPECSQCGTFPIYADDATYVCTSNSRTLNQDRITEKLDKIQKYLSANKLAINLKKTSITEFMIPQKRGRITGKSPELLIVDKGEPKIIKDSKNCRILGSTLQNNLSWQSHLETAERAVLPEARKKLGALHSLRDRLPQESRLQLATSLVISKLVYMITLWGGATQNYVRKAQILMNRAARFVTKMPRKTRIRTLLEKCRWLSVKEMIKFHSLLQLWKILRMKKPESMYRKYTMEEDDKISTTGNRL